MIRLAGAGWQAALLPQQGAAFASLEWQGQPVLAPLAPGADPNGSFAGAFLMAPWCNRLDAGRLGAEHRLPVNRLPVNRVAENTAIHGLSREQPWQVAAVAADRVLLRQRLVRQPFDYAAELEVTLGAALHLALRLRNLGAAPVPMGLGWHPWFHRTPGMRLRLGARTALLSDARNLPVAAEPSTGLDAPLEALEGLDRHYAGWDGAMLLERPGLAIVLAASGVWAGNIQVFVPVGGQAMCAEPVSHIPDAPNRPALAAAGPLALLAPGAEICGALTLRCSGGGASTAA